MASFEKPTHLEPSKLGTKEYWDTLYTREISNHSSNPADEGTVWFDDSDAQEKILDFLSEELPQISSRFSRLSPSEASVLDLGSGNGSLLFALRSEGGFTGRLVGVDYSSSSVELSRRIALARSRGGGGGGGGGGGNGDDDDADEEDEDEDEGEGEGEGEEPLDVSGIEFRQFDLLSDPIEDIQRISSEVKEQDQDRAQEQDGRAGNEQSWGYDLVLDKGTFDAVSLSDQFDPRGRRVNEGYGERVLQLLKTGGVFLVTSCNWTEPELQKWFEGSEEPDGGKGRLRMIGRIDYPSFEFGGVKGQTISTLCFEKVVV